MRIPPLHLVLSGTVLIAGLAAQTTYVAPFGYQSSTGNSNNTIPWWAGSATYQQVHNATDLAWVFPSFSVGLIRGLSFRPAATYTLLGRLLDAQITLGVTTVTSTAPTTTFATNLGPTPMVVLPYTSVNLPTAASTATPNPQTWFFPFSTPYIYVLASGNLCWELRTKNSSSSSNSFTDAASVPTPNACFPPLFGAGCTATGQTQPASITNRSLAVSTGAFTSQLERGSLSAPAAMVLGDTRQLLTLPGLCTPLETLPLLSLGGTTDAAGSWNVVLTLGNLSAFPRATVYAQFAFADPGLTHGFGLSSCSPVTLPGTSTFSNSRIYAVPSSSGQGNELALTGTVGASYGLVVGFDT